MTKQLDKYRSEIDQIDHQLVDLLEKRFKQVELVSQYKKEHNLAVLDTSREEQVLQKIAEMTKDKEKTSYLQSIFKEIMHQSRNWQHEDRKD